MKHKFLALILALTLAPEGTGQALTHIGLLIILDAHHGGEHLSGYFLLGHIPRHCGRGIAFIAVDELVDGKGGVAAAGVIYLHHTIIDESGKPAY